METSMAWIPSVGDTCLWPELSPEPEAQRVRVLALDGNAAWVVYGDHAYSTTSVFALRPSPEPPQSVECPPVNITDGVEATKGEE